MAELDHQHDAIADRYARALLDLVGRNGEADKVLAGLEALSAQLAKDHVLDDAMRSSAVDPEVRSRAIEKACRGKLPDLLVNGLLVINRKGRMGLLPVIANRYRLGLEAKRNEVEVHVTTAVPIDKDLRERVMAAVHRATGQTARPVEHVDPSIIGGIVVKVGDRKFDGSVRRRLRRLAERFADRAVEEIHRTSEHVELGR